MVAERFFWLKWRFRGESNEDESCSELSFLFAFRVRSLIFLFEAVERALNSSTKLVFLALSSYILLLREISLSWCSTSLSSSCLIRYCDFSIYFFSLRVRSIWPGKLWLSNFPESYFLSKNFPVEFICYFVISLARMAIFLSRILKISSMFEANSFNFSFTSVLMISTFFIFVSELSKSLLIWVICLEKERISLQPSWIYES